MKVTTSILDPNNADMNFNVPCETKMGPAVVGQGVMLGIFGPRLSNAATLDGHCQRFSWWLNGIQQAHFDFPIAVTPLNVNLIMTWLTPWSNIPLVSGSIIGTLSCIFSPFSPVRTHHCFNDYNNDGEI